uniref:Protein root UVB sensitive/RUS domain-containing protein n=1 Tax=Glossina morsitans morsitans TaxID=37546 RepID=A0A1B0FLK9_GLOMM
MPEGFPSDFRYIIMRSKNMLESKCWLSKITSATRAAFIGCYFTLNLLWLIAAVAAVALNADDSVWTTIANYETKMTDGEDDDDDDDDANVDDDSHSPPLQLQRPLHDDLRRLLLIDVRVMAVLTLLPPPALVPALPPLVNELPELEPIPLWPQVLSVGDPITGGVSGGVEGTPPGTLCTHAIPKGLGVGNENINAYSATVTWILKEGSGHLRRILFSWWKGAKLDVESKKWPLRAHFLNDCAMGIEIFMLSKYPHLSTYILCGSTTVLKERRRLRHFDVDGRRRIEAPNKVDGAGGVVRGENVAVVTSDLSS